MRMFKLVMTVAYEILEEARKESIDLIQYLYQ